MKCNLICCNDVPWMRFRDMPPWHVRYLSVGYRQINLRLLLSYNQNKINFGHISLIWLIWINIYSGDTFIFPYLNNRACFWTIFKSISWAFHDSILWLLPTHCVPWNPKRIHINIWDRCLKVFHVPSTYCVPWNPKWIHIDMRDSVSIQK